MLSDCVMVTGKGRKASSSAVAALDAAAHTRTPKNLGGGGLRCAVCCVIMCVLCYMSFLWIQLYIAS